MAPTQPERPMQIIYEVPDGQYTQVPNALLACDHLSASHKVTWMQLASACRNGRSHDSLNSITRIATHIGQDPANFRTAVSRLAKAGGIIKEQDEWTLVIPSEEAPEPTIQDEIEEAPKRKHTLTQKEAWVLIKNGWNKAKPENWLRLDGSLNLPVYIAFETQAKRLNIEREDYERFTAQVCRGASADQWWSNQNMKASSVFGFSKVTDKKFENVEKLYKAGASVEVEIDFKQDSDILARYHEKGRTDIVRIIRLEATGRMEAEQHLENIPDEEYDETCAYIYFSPTSDKPVHWSGRSLNSTRYLFS